MAADLLYQGEFRATEAPLRYSRRVANTRDFAGYTFGYNPTLFARRVHDVLTMIKFVVDDEHPVKHLHLLGVEGGAPWVVAARALADDAVDSTAIDDAGFRFRQITSWRDVNFLPGAVKYGDLPALLGLCAPHRIWMPGEVPELTARIYEAAGSSGHIQSATTATPLTAAVTWIANQ